MSEKTINDLQDLNRIKCPDCHHPYGKHFRVPPVDPSRMGSRKQIPWICSICEELKLPDCKHYMNTK